MQVRLLGSVDVVVGERVTSAGASERSGMLAALALSPGQVVPFDRLVACMWADAAPRDVASAVRFHASRLRRLVDAGLVARGGGYVLEIGEDDVDALRFERLVRAGQACVGDDPAVAGGRLDEALALWRGPPLPGVAAEPFVPEVRRLEELRLAAVQARLAAALACGRHGEVVGDLERLVAEDPLREGAWALLATALYRCGRQADALAAHQRLRRTLAEELGVEPSGELRELEHRILVQDPSLDHRPRAAAAGPGVHAPRPVLPRPLSSFVGRHHELAAIDGLLEQRRLVTLVAPGGAGKTRLALEAAQRARPRFPGGVHLVDLAPLRRPAEVARAVARALGVTDALAERAGVEATLGRAAASVGDGRHLLLLDNCEHLVEACAHAAAALLDACPNLVVLATSRQLLDLPGEQLLPLSGLEPPAEDTVPAVVASPAGALFLDRARAVRPDLSVGEAEARAVAVICRRLDGLPLAVELAAARTRVLSPTQVAERLDDAFAVLASRGGHERHRSLDAALRWSHDLLDEPEQALLARLSVFVGGFTLDAAEAVAGDLGAPVLDVLGSLVDKSFVVSGPAAAGGSRYRLLEVVRQFAARALRDRAAENDARRRHRDHYVATAKAALPTVYVASEEFARLSAEVGNVRAAVRWSLAQGEPVVAVDLVGAYGCWMGLGLFPEAVELLLGAVDAVDATDATATDATAHAIAMATASAYAAFAGRVDEARRQWERLGALLPPEGDPSLVRARWLSSRGTWECFAADGDLRRGEALMVAASREYAAAGVAYPVPDVGRLWAVLCLDLHDEDWWARTVGDAVARARTSPLPRQANIMLLWEQAHRAARGAEVDLATCDRLLAEFGPPGVDFEANPAVLGHGLVHELAGDRRRALADARQHVWWCQRAGVLGHLPLSLRSTVRLLAPTAPEAAATVHAAYEAVTAAHGLKRDLPLFDRLDAAALARCAAALGADALAQARDAGRAMSAADAAAAALDALDAALAAGVRPSAEPVETPAPAQPPPNW